MKNLTFIRDYQISYVEIYTHMAKSIAYWHQHALGFSLVAKYINDEAGTSSYLVKSNSIRLMLTSSYPVGKKSPDNIYEYTEKNYCGVKRFALNVPDVKEAFTIAVKNGAIPIKPPCRLEDEFGCYDEASIKLYDDNEIAFVNDSQYKGVFKPHFILERKREKGIENFIEVDHIAAELRINEINFWTNYLSNTISTELVQKIQQSEDNVTGMLLNVNQSHDKKLTLVMAEPDPEKSETKIQRNINRFGPGIHHLAFSTDDIIGTLEQLQQKQVEFVNFPPAYYELLRENAEMKDLDIDRLEKFGILVDKEGDTYLLQKFIAPITERPYFFYEIVQRINGYSGFALKNINVLKKAEESQLIKG